MKIEILKRKEIKPPAWNDTVTKAFNSSPFAYTWFLDTVCDDWFGVVINDYEKIIPFPFFSFMKKRYVYMPKLIPYLGLFSKTSLKQNEIDTIFEFIKKNNYAKILEYRANRFNKSDKMKIKKLPALHIFDIYPEIFFRPKKNQLKLNVDYKIYVGESTILFNNFIRTNGLIKSQQKLKKITRLIAEMTFRRNGIAYSIYDTKDKLIGFAFLTIEKNNIFLLYWDTIEKNKEKVFLSIINFIIHKSTRFPTTLLFEKKSLPPKHSLNLKKSFYYFYKEKNNAIVKILKYKKI